MRFCLLYSVYFETFKVLSMDEPYSRKHYRLVIKSNSIFEINELKSDFVKNSYKALNQARNILEKA